MVTAKQCKAARALLNWTLDDLANHSGVNRGVISKLEQGVADVRRSTVEKLYDSFSKANIQFIGSAGVTEKQDDVELLSGPGCLEKLWDNILLTLGDTGGEVLITNVDERRTIEFGDGDLISYLENLKSKNITERLLSCEGDYCFIMPKKCYRWLSKEVFSMGTSTYIYANKVAYQLWGGQIIILVHSSEAHLAETKRFEYMWTHAAIPLDKPQNKQKDIKSA